MFPCNRDMAFVHMRQVKVELKREHAVSFPARAGYSVFPLVGQLRRARLAL